MLNGIFLSRYRTDDPQAAATPQRIRDQAALNLPPTVSRSLLNLDGGEIRRLISAVNTLRYLARKTPADYYWDWLRNIEELFWLGSSYILSLILPTSIAGRVMHHIMLVEPDNNLSVFASGAARRKLSTDGSRAPLLRH